MKTTFKLNGNTHTIALTEELAGVTEIHVKGVRWFQKTYGNTYQTAYISVVKNGRYVELGHTGMNYGYGDHYLVSAGEWLIENGYIESDQNSGYYLTRLNMLDLGLPLTCEAVDVKRKKDM